PAASEDVGQRRYKERPDVAEADQRQQIPQGPLGNLETFLDLLEREGQQSSVVLIEESRRGRDQEHAPLPFCERGRSAKDAERDAFALFGERRASVACASTDSAR